MDAERVRRTVSFKAPNLELDSCGIEDNTAPAAVETSPGSGFLDRNPKNESIISPDEMFESGAENSVRVTFV
jgi:hypothetical protein